MNPELIVLRLMHVVLGAFWAGTLIFFALFLEPSVREAGPDGAKVMQGLMKRKFLNVMPTIAILTILSGLRLYQLVSNGFDTAWMKSGQGIALTTGGLSAIIALGIGLAVMRPAAMKVGQLSQQIQANPANVGDLQAAVADLKGRSRTAGRWIALLLTIAAATMAIARFV